MQFHKLHICETIPFFDHFDSHANDFSFFFKTHAQKHKHALIDREESSRDRYTLFSSFRLSRCKKASICEFVNLRLLIIDILLIIFDVSMSEVLFFLLNKIINKNVICNKLQKNFILKLYCNLFKLFISIIDILLLISYDI